MITIGLEALTQAPSLIQKGLRYGLLTNQASVNRDLVHNRILLKNLFGESLTTLFSPQHGFYSEKQDNMIESGDEFDLVTGLPIYSLYGDLRKPNRKMLDNVDILLIDLMDVGTRVYTFLYTMANCLEAAAEFHKKVIILDRPNPVGGVMVEGNVLRDDCASFVGMYPIPMRHGMTFAELGLFINEEFGIGAELEVIPMRGWKRQMCFEETGFPWVFPSPNMPTPDTAMVYPGQVIWEGTNVSEGRGTTLPFEIFGAPFIDHNDVLKLISTTDLPGIFLRPLLFEPTSGKWAKQVCSGFQLHVTDKFSYRPYRTSLALLQAVCLLYPEQFKYKEPPYEYEFSRLPMDLILGSIEVRKQLENGAPVIEMENVWREELEAFVEKRGKYFLYSL
jgi:uncharacterized protein YbbC (DUF1343 family)